MVLTISQFLTQIGLDENYKFFILSDSVSIFTTKNLVVNQK